MIDKKQKKEISPKLRFAQFTHPWDEYTLGELYTERNERGNDSLQILSVSIHSGVSDGELDEASLGKTVRRSEDKSKYKHVYNGDLIFNMMRAWQGAIGVAKSEGMISPAYIAAIPSHKVFPLFMDYAIRRKEKIEEIDSLSYGVTDFRKRLYWDSFVRISCSLPSIEEQKRIYEYFKNLDNLICLYKQKCNELTAYKNGMLQKMFPNQGQTEPEWRFAGFTGPWGHYKCGDVLKERNIQHPQSEEYPLVSFTVENGVTPKTDRYEREQLVRGDKKAKKYKETRLDDIVYNPANLKFGAIARNKYGNAVFSPIYVTYEVNNGIALASFVEMCVIRDSFIQNALQYQQGTVYERMAVNTKDFANLDIMIPTRKEQLKIGEYFHNIDNLIVLHQRKVETLEKYKKGLLQQMFV